MEGKSGASSRGNSAPIAYIKVAAVKKFVVGSQSRAGGSPHGATTWSGPLAGSPGVPFTGCPGDQSVYFEKIGVLKAGERLNIVHGIMEKEPGAILLVFGTRGNG